MPYDDDYEYGYYDDYDAERDCEHEHYEIDVCTGRAECDYCSKSWDLSSEELDRQANYQEQVERDQRRHERREFWRELTYPIRWPIYRVLERVWPRKSLVVLTDDEIPF